MDSDLLIVGGIALLYFLTRPSTAYPQTYPSTQPRPSTSGGTGGGSGGGTGGGSIPGASGGTPFTPAPSSGPVQGPPNPFTGQTYDPNTGQWVNTTPSGSNDPCDYTSPAYDPTACAAQYGSTDIPVPVPPPPTDSGDPCDPNSYAYDPSLCSGGGGPADTGGGDSVDAMQML